MRNCADSIYCSSSLCNSFTPPNALLSIANHTFILLDSVSLVEEDYRRYAAEVQLGEWDGVRGGVIEFIKALGEGEFARSSNKFGRGS